MKNNKDRSKIQRGLAALLTLMLVLGTPGAGPVYAAAMEEAQTPVITAELPAEAAAEMADDEGNGDSSEMQPETQPDLPAETEEVTPEETKEEPSAAEVTTAAETTMAAETGEEIPDLDYILGRPMTEEEIEEQKALEPNCLLTIPVLSAARTVGLDLNHVEYNGVELNPDTLPEAYDARAVKNWDTSVKNQLPYGSCWAFSAVSNAETSLIRQGLRVSGATSTASNTDLSELQLLYYFYHPLTDALGNTEGDRSYSMGGVDYLNRGGHGIYTTFAMASWIGLIPEGWAPYEKAGTTLTLDDRLCYAADVVHMQNAHWVKMTDLDAVKLLVRKCGNVSVSFNFDTDNLNHETAAYYNAAKTSTNHSVNIVGWDDHYSRDNFVTAPAHDGAWLVKNNWGPDWEDHGYFWISYDDASFTGNAAFGYVYDFETADNYDHIYQYDGSWNFVNRSMASGSSVANVFTASGSEREELKAVSIAMYSPNTEYSVQIYREPAADDPTSGTPVLDTPQTGLISYAGYATIPLEQKGIILREGEKYSVVFTLAESNGGTVRVLEDKTGTNGPKETSWIGFVNDTAPGQSFVKTSSTWKDLGAAADGSALGTSGETIRIKAFTVDQGVIHAEGIELDRSELTLTEGESAVLTARILPADAEDAETIVWESSDASVAVVENGTVRAGKTGTAEITAVSGAFRASCKVTVNAPIHHLESIKLDRTELVLTEGDSVTLTAQALPADAVEAKSILWESSDPSVVAVENGTVRAGKAGTAVISAVSGSIRASCKVTVDPLIRHLESVVMDRPELTLFYGEKATLTVKPVPANAIEDVGTYTWKSSGSSVAKVKNGVVTAKGVGTCTITATRKDGFQAQCQVTVTLDKVKLKDIAVTGYRKIRIRWNKVPGAKSYRVYRRSEGEDWTLVKVVKGYRSVSYTNKVPDPDTEYYYTVRACSSRGGYGTLGELEQPGLSAKTRTKTPHVVSVNQTSRGLKITWDKVDCAGYRIYRRTEDGQWQYIKKVSGKNKYYYIDKKAGKNVTYTYTVRSYRSSGRNVDLSGCEEPGVMGLRS